MTKFLQSKYAIIVAFLLVIAGLGLSLWSHFNSEKNETQVVYGLFTKTQDGELKLVAKFKSKFSKNYKEECSIQESALGKDTKTVREICSMEGSVAERACNLGIFRLDLAKTIESKNYECIFLEGDAYIYPSNSSGD